MKKFLAFLLAGMMLLGAAVVPASAEYAYSIRAVDVSIVRGTDKLIVLNENSSYYLLADRDGQVIVNESAGYTSIYPRDYGFLEVEVVSEDGVHDTGVIDIAGNVVVPAQYADIDYISDRWVAGIKLVPCAAEDKDYTYTNWSTDAKSYYRVDVTDFYYNGALVGSLSRSDCKSGYCRGYAAYLRVTNIAGDYVWYNNRMERSPYTGSLTTEVDSIYRNGKYTYYHAGSGQQMFVDTCTLDPNDVTDPYLYDHAIVYDIRGNQLYKTEQSYDYVYAFVDGYAQVRMNSLSGMINEAGQEVIPPLYSNLGYASDQNPFEYGYVSATLDGKFGFLDAQGNVSCPFTYPDNIVQNRTTFGTLKNLDGTIIVLSGAVGELPEHYAEVNFPTSRGCRAFEARNSEGQRAVIDLYGNALIPFTDDYNRLDISYDGTLVVGYCGNRTYDVYHFSYDAPAAPAVEEPVAQQPTEQPAPAAEDGWTCENGHGGNNGNFCTVCGAPKPVVEEPAAEDDGTWTCVNGHSGNVGNFCSECGAPKPVEEPAPLTHCPNCNYEFGDTVPKFCPNCGAAINP